MTTETITAIVPKLPMRNKQLTLDYYTQKLNFEIIGSVDFPDYLMLKKENCEIHFFLFEELNPLENYGQVYIRTNAIQEVYEELLKNETAIHPNGKLQTKPWGQIEFSLLDPDFNLITFGQNA